jgi:hypothetical protein
MAERAMKKTPMLAAAMMALALAGCAHVCLPGGCGTAAVASHIPIPREYDHAFAGELSIMRKINAIELAEICGSTRPIVACALMPGTRGLKSTECTIVLGEKTFLEKSGYTVEEAEKHERAHCNGWRHAD